MESRTNEKQINCLDICEKAYRDLNLERYLRKKADYSEFGIIKLIHQLPV